MEIPSETKEFVKFLWELEIILKSCRGPKLVIKICVRLSRIVYREMTAIENKWESIY